MLSRHTHDMARSYTTPCGSYVSPPCRKGRHPTMLVDELEIQHRDKQELIAGNTIVVDDNLILQRELTNVRDEINTLSHIVPELQAEKETQIRDLIHRKLKLEAELRGFELLKCEFMCLRDEVEELGCLRKELSEQVEYLTGENRLVGAQIDGLRKDIAEARNTLEYERKWKVEQIARREVLDDKIILLARERERLRAELTMAERKTGGIGVSIFDSTDGSPDVRHPASGYGDNWFINAREAYVRCDSPHR